MRLNAVSITPQGNNVVLTGKNKQGKTSVLRSIISVLSGKDSRPEKLLREGTEKGEITITIGDTKPELVAKLKVTENGESLILTTADGAKYSSPQSILDGLKGSIGFEPMRFLTEDSKKQAQMLRDLVGLDFRKLDEQRKTLFDERTAVNRELKQAETVYEAMPYHDDAPEQEATVAELAGKLQQANAKNNENAQQRTMVENIAERGEELAGQIETAQAELLEMEKAIEAKRAKIKDDNSKLEALRHAYDDAKKSSANLQDIDTTQITQSMQSAEEINRKVRQNLNKKTWKSQMDDKRELADSLTAQIDEIDKKKADDLKAANMPVQGLSFTDDGILYNGLPLDQASGAEALIVALGMGTAMNSKLRILLFRDASLLDSDSRRIVDDFCEKHNVQAWLETVDSQEAGAIVITDGKNEE